MINNILPKKSERAKTNPKFLVVSHLVFYKGIQDLIVAVNLLPKHLLEGLSIDVFGDGPYREALLVLVNSHKLDSVFNFKGSSATLNATYKNYDYLIQPTHMECFSLSILESLAANIPVITTPVGGNKEVITNGKNGYIFKTKDSHALSLLLEAIVTGKQYIKENTRPLVETKFSITLMVENHFELLN